MTDRSATAAKAKLALIGVVAEVLRYCGRYAGPLIRLSWFPCLLTAIGLIVLEVFIIGRAEQTPEWILSDDFYPPSWIAALLPAPFHAMVWMSVVGSMQRGEPPKSSGLLGLDLNERIILAAVILSILNLMIGGSRNLERMFLVNGLALIHGPTPSQEVLEAWVGAVVVIHGIIAIVVSTICYVMAGPVIEHGRLKLDILNALTHGSRFRLLVLFAILGALRGGFVLLIDPAVGWLTDNFTDTSSWTLAESIIRHGTYIPISMLTFVGSAVAVGIALRRLEQAAPA